MSRHTFHWKSLAVSLSISLGVGGLSSLLTHQSMKEYTTLQKPPLSPSPIVFPIAWTLLFLLMGLSAWMIYRIQIEACHRKKGWFIPALRLYAAQLAVNFLWPVLFFNLHLRLFSFFWLVLLLNLVGIMMFRFYQAGKACGAPDPELSPLFQTLPARENRFAAYGKAAALLQIPYVLWLCFAGYLNLGIWFLNR